MTLVDGPKRWVTHFSRHDKIVSLVQTATAKAGWSCLREPAIPTQASLRRPDLSFHHSDRSTFVLDIMIVADNAVLEDAHSRK